MKRSTRSRLHPLQWYANTVLRVVYGNAGAFLSLCLLAVMIGDPVRRLSPEQAATLAQARESVFVAWLIALLGFVMTHLWLKQNPRR